MKTLTIIDESAAGDILHQMSLQFEKEYITAKELIEKRIEEEINNYKNQVNDYKNGLVLPTNLEKRLNNKKTPKIDLEKQKLIAFDAFQNNHFILLIDDEQVEDLQQKYLVDETAKVSFIKLTPLVGG
ncbi:MAG: hypothetical protein ACPGSD_04570 [Flavobacteriales bacterium]